MIARDHGAKCKRWNDPMTFFSNLNVSHSILIRKNAFKKYRELAYYYWRGIECA